MPQTFTSEEQFRALFEYATEGILVTDAAGTIQVVNPSAEKLFGYPSGELVGKKVELLMPQRYSGHHARLRQEFGEHPKPRSMGTGRELFGIKKDATEFPVEISLSPYTADAINYTIAFIIDISQRKKNEQSILQQKTELERTAQDLEKRVKDRTMILEEALQQLEISRKDLHVALDRERELGEMKTKFVSMASHEFRTPLTTILSSLSLVAKYAEADNKEKQQQHIQRIKTAIGNMTALLDDVLSISKLEEGWTDTAAQPMDLESFTESIVQEMLLLVKPGQRIEHRHTGPPEAFISPKGIRTILVNLISNAIKFSPDNSTITVSTSVASEEIGLFVKDSGIGIEEADQLHLFERFFRGHNATHIQGTGLGLSIVARYVELLNGKIDMQSQLHKGTSFTVTIPNSQHNGQKDITDRG